MILVSACLLGQSTRYDGGHCLAPELWVRLQGRPHMALCPEVLGGLPVPRPPARIVGATPGREGLQVLEGVAKIVTQDGNDISRQFIQGARRVLSVAKSAGVTRALLKDRSPSCAWDPLAENPQGGPRQGVLAALLLSEGIEVVEVRAEAAGLSKPSENAQARA
ncbi:hypothetical protein AAU61_18030 [Desulfocarbo indianensis]|nr:hypothetical protein AAU61_18030 [Desulfocarbo indianensis]